MTYIPEYPRLLEDVSTVELVQAFNQLTRQLSDKEKLPIKPYTVHGKVTLVNADYQMQPDDGVILANTTLGTVNVYLRNANENRQNFSKRVIIKKTTSAHSVIVHPASGQTIDGSATITLNTLHDVRRLTSDGFNWWVI
jgi:hypothetical protein